MSKSFYFDRLTDEQWRDAKPFRDEMDRLLSEDEERAAHVLAHPENKDRSHPAGQVWMVRRVRRWLQEYTDE